MGVVSGRAAHFKVAGPYFLFFLPPFFAAFFLPPFFFLAMRNLTGLEPCARKRRA